MPIESWLKPPSEARRRHESRAIEEQRVGERLDSLPKIIFVPAHPALDKPLGAIEIELFTLKAASEVIAVAFSTSHLLVDRLGDAQPWIATDSLNFQRSVIRAGVAGIVVDPIERVIRPRWSRSTLTTFAKALNG